MFKQSYNAVCETKELRMRKTHETAIVDRSQNSPEIFSSVFLSQLMLNCVPVNRIIVVDVIVMHVI